MKQLADCIKQEIGNRITRDEEGKSITFFNDKYTIVGGVVEIENCVLTGKDDGKRCDYLFLFDLNKQQYKVLKNNKAFYIELKGIDIEEAYLQLINSIKKTESQIENFEKNAIIVSSREYVPNFDNTDEYTELKTLIRKDIKFGLLNYEVEITN